MAGKAMKKILIILALSLCIAALFVYVSVYHSGDRCGHGVLSERCVYQANISSFLSSETAVDWNNWQHLDGAVVFVSDGRVGAMTFIIEGGSVDLDIGGGVTVGALMLSPEGAIVQINNHQRVVPVGHTETVDGVSVRVEEIIFR